MCAILPNNINTECFARSNESLVCENESLVRKNGPVREDLLDKIVLLCICYFTCMDLTLPESNFTTFKRISCIYNILGNQHT